MELGQNKKKIIDLIIKFSRTCSREESFVSSKLFLNFALPVALETTFWRLCWCLRNDSEYDLGFYPRF